jgi:hypothetical protein
MNTTTNRISLQAPNQVAGTHTTLSLDTVLDLLGQETPQREKPRNIRKRGGWDIGTEIGPDPLGQGAAQKEGDNGCHPAGGTPCILPLTLLHLKLSSPARKFTLFSR